MCLTATTYPLSVTLGRLVKKALRMRPDLLVVGRVREAESLDMLIVLTSGCTCATNPSSMWAEIVR